jgi:hypothetical protein
MRPPTRTAEQVIGALAFSEHGVVTREWMRDAGVTPAQVARLVRNGVLIREYRGVYRVGHRAPVLEARYLAAVLACGEGALLRGPAAAFLLGLLRGDAPPPEVLTPVQRRVRGVRTVRARRTGIDEEDRMVWRAVPVTSVPRTLVDLAGTLPLVALARACHEAGIRYGTTPRAVANVLDRRPNAPGAKRLVLVLTGDAPVTLSKLERGFLRVLRDAGLPLPQTNRRTDGSYVDCRWPEHRLTVELDSFRYHNSRHAWEGDRRREREARARGDEHRRYTWTDVFDHPAPMIAELSALLRRCPS